MPIYVFKDKLTWRLVYDDHTKKRHIPKKSEEARLLGFDPTWTVEQAKARGKQIQDEEWVKRQAEMEAKRARIITRNKRYRGAFLLDADVEEFELKYIKERGIRETHWRTALELIYHSHTHPTDWFERPSVILDQCAKRKYSRAYVRALLIILNYWGYFLCKKQNKAWQKVELRGTRWLRTFKEDENASEPLTIALLAEAKKKLKEPHYLWVERSFWWGLRPREVNLLTTPNSKWHLSSEDGVRFLSVFQDKLAQTGKYSEEECWKHIPIIWPEQEALVEGLGKSPCKQPIYRKFHEVFGPDYTPYAGRKGFGELVLERGFDVYDKMKWMGHTRMDETLDAYTKKGKHWFPKKKAG